MKWQHALPLKQYPYLRSCTLGGKYGFVIIILLWAESYHPSQVEILLFWVSMIQCTSILGTYSPTTFFLRKNTTSCVLDAMIDFRSSFHNFSCSLLLYLFCSIFLLLKLIYLQLTLKKNRKHLVTMLVSGLWMTFAPEYVVLLCISEHIVLWLYCTGIPFLDLK